MSSNTHTLFICGFNKSADEHYIKSIFNRYGTIIDLRMQRNFAFVDYDSKFSADRAIKEEDGKMYDGMRLGVQYSRQKSNSTLPIELTPSTSYFEKKAEAERNGSYSFDSSSSFKTTEIDSLFPQVKELADRGKIESDSSQAKSSWSSHLWSGDRGVDNEMNRSGMTNMPFPSLGGTANRNLSSDVLGKRPRFEDSNASYSDSLGMSVTGSNRSMGGVGSGMNMSGMGNMKWSSLAGDMNIGGTANRSMSSDVLGKRPRFEDSNSSSFDQSVWNRGGSDKSPEFKNNPLPPARFTAPPPSRSSPDLPPGIPKDLPSLSRKQRQPLSVDSHKPRVNDCEIIAINKSLRGYAEHIELKMKDAGVQVDILFPNDLSALPLIIADITSRGVSYAITITSEDEVTDSVTVTYLQTSPQKRMRLFAKDAVDLVKRSTGNSVDKPKLAVASASTAPLNNSIPEEILLPLGILMEGRPLSVAEYDKVLDYLTDKRDELAKKMGVPSRQKSTSDKPTLTKEAIYQNVLTILKEKTVTTVPTSTEDNPDLYDMNSPLMKKALESLLANKNALSMLHTYSSRMLSSPKK